MANRQQRRSQRKLARKGGVRTEGEVQLGVSVRAGSVVMNLVGPDGRGLVLGVPPDSARQFAVALDDAAEAVTHARPAPDVLQKYHYMSCPKGSGPVSECPHCSSLKKELDEGE